MRHSDRTWANYEKWYKIAHRVWIEHYGQIPAGRYIHHIDGDITNNALDNLMLIDPLTHTRWHSGWYLLDDGTWLKHCRGCGVYRTLVCFSAHRVSYRPSKTGIRFDSLCKECNLCRLRDRRKTEKFQEWQRRYSQSDKGRATRKRWYQEHQEQMRVYQKEYQRKRYWEKKRAKER